MSEEAWGWTERELFAGFAAYLTEAGRPTKLLRVGAIRAGGWFARRVPRALPDSFACLQHEASGDFWVLSCEDGVDGSLDWFKAVADDRRCRLILKQQYRADSFRGVLARKVRPWTYTAMHPQRLQERLPRLRAAPRSGERLYFRGKCHYSDRSEVLAMLRAAGALVTDDSIVPFDEYCDDLASRRLALALPGWGNLCHREIEAFGMGTPVLMPRLHNRLHNELVPDEHYVSVDVDSLSAPPEDVARAILERWREVKDDDAFLQAVALNAMKWYDENAAVPACYRLTAALLQLHP